MTTQTFIMNDGSAVELHVVIQRSKRLEAFTIQISQVLDYNNLDNATFSEEGIQIPYRFVYEEINNDEDSVLYTHFVSRKTVETCCPWFF